MRAAKLRSIRAGNGKGRRTMKSLDRAALVFGLLGAATLAACVGSSSAGTDEPSAPPTWVLEVLTPDKGVSIPVPSFEVPAGHEEQSCYFMSFPDIHGGQDVFINRIRLAMNVGSHHMNIFRVRTLIDLRTENGEPIK